MANFDKSLEAVDCNSHCVRYDMDVNRGASGHLTWHMVSSGHLRRCSDADTVEMSLSRVNDASILSWPTLMGH
eukprot:scaffold5812_cov121-Skeletonema_marinoi.AAC.2